MAQAVIQTAFHSGEWAPALYARVDLAKYHTAMAFGENYYVDYRGGASSRGGTKYILQAFKSSTPVRLIPFQASFTVGYVLEFGDFYIRFYNNGAPVLEPSANVLGVTRGVNTAVDLGAAAKFAVAGDWVYLNGIVGTTELNNKYFTVLSVVPLSNIATIGDLNGNPINSTAYGAYVGGGTSQLVYTLPSPYAAADLALLKFAQNVTAMVLCHPNYVPYVLTLITATNWTINPIDFGSTIAAPTGLGVTSTLAAGSVNYSYLVTAVDANGQESGPSTPVALGSKTDLRTVAGTNNVSWSPVPGATSYNVYKAELSYSGVIPSGAQYGFIGNTQASALADSNRAPDFTLTPPVPQNPFQGSGISAVNITNRGAYATVPTATIAAAPAGGQTATVSVTLAVTAAAVPGGGDNTFVGQLLVPHDDTYGGLQLRVTSVNGGGQVTGVAIANSGSITSGAIPTNPVLFNMGSVGSGSSVQINLTWGVGNVNIINAGSGYLVVPAVTFSSGTAAGTTSLASAFSGNPSVPQFFQQRMVLAAPSRAPQQFNMSQPGSPYNYDISNPIQPDDAIAGQLISGQLNTIKALIPQPVGLIALSDRAAWLLNGGQGAEAITPINAVANTHSFNGASDVPPVVANDHILYVQAKGSIIRDMSYDFYKNVYTGTDISVLSSHLFFGYQILEWAWAEEPFKVCWTIRNDGTLLSLTYMKEQELIGWCHSITQGEFKSVATVVEAVDDFGDVDAIYVVVEREVSGQTVKYIERLTDRTWETMEDAWCVDAGLQYRGALATSFSGGEHLAGLTCVGLADGMPITPFVMPANGNFTLPAPGASVVTVGLSFKPILRTLPLDIGEPTVQGKRKKITGVTVRVKETLGLTIGSDADNQTPMKDLALGNVGTQSNLPVENLVTGDARTILNPTWTEDGVYQIEQPNPWPSTILGVIPEISIGDDGSSARNKMSK